MATSKIAQLRENVGQWTASDGTTFYKNNVQLENGVQGETLSKSPQPPYAVGDEVEYEERRSQHGTRLKLRKPSGYSNGGYNGGGNDAKGPRIMRQSAMKVAAMMLGAGKPFQEYVNAAESCVKYFEQGVQQAQQAPQVETRYTQTSTNEMPF